MYMAEDGCREEESQDRCSDECEACDYDCEVSIPEIGHWANKKDVEAIIDLCKWANKHFVTLFIKNVKCNRLTLLLIGLGFERWSDEGTWARDPEVAQAKWNDQEGTLCERL
jgi:hypothetical protein